MSANVQDIDKMRPAEHCIKSNSNNPQASQLSPTPAPTPPPTATTSTPTSGTTPTGTPLLSSSSSPKFTLKAPLLPLSSDVALTFTPRNYAHVPLCHATPRIAGTPSDDGVLYAQGFSGVECCVV
ncbi:hypothetical protein DFJ58DRAFT_751768 [Suillus subalutaceus]|uniref:uncharacterized protein n=1 Tax=Suillus subalutaceus TaxID=48586 RepID=UPI001B87D0DC|nr:uncharacterized protein DFJ58DRAFT_751768 [Suillus subalutaceus]KAG1814861.1 hypothetical protein DFJ58DRAFT_751768 [Suillus subalutaceus]